MEGNWRVFNRGRQGRTYISRVRRNMKTIIFIWPPHMLHKRLLNWCVLEF
jgi:hypothetical protein